MYSINLKWAKMFSEPKVSSAKSSKHLITIIPSYAARIVSPQVDPSAQWTVYALRPVEAVMLASEDVLVVRRPNAPLSQVTFV